MAIGTDAAQQANRSGLDPKRLVVIFYLVAAIVTGLFSEHILAMVWAQVGWPDPEVIAGVAWKVTTLVAYGLAAGLAIGCYFYPPIHELSIEVASELMRVTWPSWQETRVSTIAVILASLLASALLFGIDTLAFKFMVEWVPKLWGRL
jgi:preprotein translocase subunit SecE